MICLLIPRCLLYLVHKLLQQFGDILTIKGKGIHSYTVFIEIISPAGEIITELMIIAANNGDFSTAWILPTTLPEGEYTIQVRDIIKKAQTKFYVGNPPNYLNEQDTEVDSKIPTWVRNIFIWYGENKISEDELIRALQFLIKEGIIKV